MKDIPLHTCARSLASIHPHLRWNIDISTDIIIHADEGLLRQVFINLIRNATEAGAKTIGIRHIAHPQSPGQGTPAAFFKMQVSNDGHIIPDNVAREIFIPFFTTKPQGSGIGLALSRQILMMQQFSLSLRERPISGYNVTFEIEDNRL